VVPAFKNNYISVLFYFLRDRVSINILCGYFGNSPASLVSHIVNEEKLSKEEIKQLKDLIEKME
jgi:predicted transcriptional regulator